MQHQDTSNPWHGRVDSLAAEPQHVVDLMRRYAAIGSRLHVNIVAQPELLLNFTRPTREPMYSA